ISESGGISTEIGKLSCLLRPQDWRNEFEELGPELVVARGVFRVTLRHVPPFGYPAPIIQLKLDERRPRLRISAVEHGVRYDLDPLHQVLELGIIQILLVQPTEAVVGREQARRYHERYAEFRRECCSRRLIGQLCCEPICS